MTDEADRIQNLHSRIGALDLAVSETLALLAVLYGDDARSKIEALRDDLVKRWKNSSIPASRELDHVKVAGPAIEVTELVFNAALDRLK